MPVENVSGYLAGLREELRGAELLGKKTVGEIKGEIARVEKLLSSRAEPKQAPEKATTDSRATGPAPAKTAAARPAAKK